MPENRGPVEEGPDESPDRDGNTRREFIKKLTYVAPVMITFQMNTAEAKDDDDNNNRKKNQKKNRKKRISPVPKTKKKKKKGGDDDD